MGRAPPKPNPNIRGLFFFKGNSWRSAWKNKKRRNLEVSILAAARVSSKSSSSVASLGGLSAAGESQTGLGGEKNHQQVLTNAKTVFLG